MNNQLDDLSKEIFNTSTSLFEDMNKINLTLINIRISVAKIDSGESKALDTIADHIARSLDAMKEKTKRLKDISKEVRDVNNSL